jgi:hypothetical protein
MVVHDGLNISGPTDAADVFELRAKASEDDGVEGWSVSVSSLEQINTLSKILDDNLQQGALGVGSTVGYASTGISTYELFEAQRAAARYGRLTGLHLRFHTSTKPPHEAPLGFAEAFTNACLLKAPLLICHDNDYGWWEIEEKLTMAREMGMNMWAEYYPYAAGSTSIGSEVLKPQLVEDALGLKYEDVMFDPSQNKFLSKNEYLKIAKEDSGRMVIVFNPPRKEWMKSWIKMPHMTVGSDAMWSTDKSLVWDSDPAKFSGHPRTSGTHSTVLRMGREANVPLMFSLSQLSYWSAKHLGDAGIEQMQVRGRMQEGMVADIVIFNPKTVTEGSTYKAGENGLPPKGLPHVIVNGQFAKRDNKATNAFHGKAIRYPVEKKGRFVPATKEQWLKNFTIDTSPLKPRDKKSDAPKKRSSVDVKKTPLENQSFAVFNSDGTNPEWFGSHNYQALGGCCGFCESKSPQ